MNPYFPTHQLDSMGAGPFGTSYTASLVNGARNQAAGDLAAAAGLSKEGLFAATKLASAAKVELARGDDVMYGVDTGAGGVPAGGTATITVTPQKRHIPQRITLTAAVAGNFVIGDIRSGVEPILATVGNISAAVFIQDSTVPPFRSVVMEVGMDFSITVTNVTGAVQRFTCTVLGKYLPWTLEAAQAVLGLAG